MRYLILAMLLAACSDSSTPAGVQATGTLGGKPLALESAAATIVTDTKGSFLLVYLSPLADACTAPSIVASGGNAIELAMYKESTGGALVADTDLTQYSTTVGGAGPWAEVDTFDRNADCTAADGEGKGDGSVTLTQASGGVYAGTFDFTHGSDHVTGSFTTDACAWTEPTTICH